jgi:hypothetical protein
MTCEEFRALVPRGPQSITDAEFAAGIVHVETCPECHAWGLAERERLAEMAGQELAAEAQKAGLARRKKVLQDQECREMVARVLPEEACQR